jgi:N-acetylglucosamine-6-sulfatase
MHPGKECGYETDINVPLIVRGPGIAPGKRQSIVSSHTDLAPTIMHLAGNQLRDSFDGQPINLHEEDLSRPEHLNVEFWGLGVPEGKYGYKGKYMFENGTGNAYVNNTYKSLRIISDDYNLYYSVWCTNEKELYDMKVFAAIILAIGALYTDIPQTDPGQLRNLLDERTKSSLLLNRSISNVVDRLDALMMVLKSCKGKTCVDPWKEIHPAGNIQSLADAMHENFDAFYDRQPKVSFTQCELGYIPESEGPQSLGVFEEDSQVYSGGQVPLAIHPDWSVMT